MMTYIFANIYTIYDTYICLQICMDVLHPYIFLSIRQISYTFALKQGEKYYKVVLLIDSDEDWAKNF